MKHSRQKSKREIELPLEKYFKNNKEVDQSMKECSSTQSAPHIIAVGGGKGGVGKSMVSSNLAASLASTSNKKVLVCDLDVGSCNLHTYLGSNVQNYFFENSAIHEFDLAKKWVQTNCEGLLLSLIHI